MKPLKAALLIFSWLSAQAFAQDTTTTDPPELHTRREAYQRDMQRAAAPIMSNYLRSLEPLKQQFSREGKLQAALAVDTEIKRVTKELEAAMAVPTTTAATGSGRLAIVSAKYGEVGGSRVLDITEHVRQVLEAGQAALVLNTRDGAQGKDPAPSAPKETVITYTIHGQTKTKTFRESYPLKFREDLK